MVVPKRIYVPISMYIYITIILKQTSNTISIYTAIQIKFT